MAQYMSNVCGDNSCEHPPHTDLKNSQILMMVYLESRVSYLDFVLL